MAIDTGYERDNGDRRARPAIAHDPPERRLASNGGQSTLDGRRSSADVRSTIGIRRSTVDRRSVDDGRRQTSDECRRLASDDRPSTATAMSTEARRRPRSAGGGALAASSLAAAEPPPSSVSGGGAGGGGGGAGAGASRGGFVVNEHESGSSGKTISENTRSPMSGRTRAHGQRARARACERLLRRHRRRIWVWIGADVAASAAASSVSAQRIAKPPSWARAGLRTEAHRSGRERGRGLGRLALRGDDPCARVEAAIVPVSQGLLCAHEEARCVGTDVRGARGRKRGLARIAHGGPPPRAPRHHRRRRSYQFPGAPGANLAAAAMMLKAFEMCEGGGGAGSPTSSWIYGQRGCAGGTLVDTGLSSEQLQSFRRRASVASGRQGCRSEDVRRMRHPKDVNLSRHRLVKTRVASHVLHCVVARNMATAMRHRRSEDGLGHVRPRRVEASSSGLPERSLLPSTSCHSFQRHGVDLAPQLSSSSMQLAADDSSAFVLLSLVVVLAGLCP